MEIISCGRCFFHDMKGFNSHIIMTIILTGILLRPISKYLIKHLRNIFLFKSAVSDFYFRYNSYTNHSTRWFRGWLRMEWINFNIHKDISKTVISPSKNALTVTNTRTMQINLRRQNCRRENNFIVI